MAKGTTFGTIHSHTHLGLIQQKVEVQPPQPKTKRIDIPGADGSKDLTEALGVGVKYADREITWTYALYPGDSWSEKQSAVSGALNGKACHIVLDEDPNYYYDGRVAVESYASDSLLKQIKVKAVCRPWKYKATEMTVSREDLGTNYKTLTLVNDRMPVVPEITVGQETTLSFEGGTYVVAAGTHKLLDIRLKEGNNALKAKVTSGSAGSITVTYREGRL